MFNLSSIFNKSLVKENEENKENKDSEQLEQKEQKEQKSESKTTPSTPSTPKSEPKDTDSKYKLAIEKIAVETSENKDTPKNTSSVLNEIQNRNATIIQVSKDVIDDQKQEKTQEIKTTSEILLQSKIANTHLKNISDNLIDEQDTSVKRVSELQNKPELNTTSETKKESNGSMSWLAAAAGFLMPIIAKLVKNAVAGVWTFVKNSIAKVWTGIKTIGSWIKSSPIGKTISTLIDKGKNFLGFGDEAVKGAKTVSTLSKLQQLVLKLQQLVLKLFQLCQKQPMLLKLQPRQRKLLKHYQHQK